MSQKLVSELTKVFGPAIIDKDGLLIFEKRDKDEKYFVCVGEFYRHTLIDCVRFVHDQVVNSLPEIDDPVLQGELWRSALILDRLPQMATRVETV